MNLTRRELGQLVIGGVGGLAISKHGGATASAQATWKPNRSLIHGVQFALQPFCYHDLVPSIENRPELIKRMLRNGLGMVELHSGWCEPTFTGPGVTPQQAREELRKWRLSRSDDHFRAIKKEFDAAGIEIFTHYQTMNDSFTDAEVDACLAGARLLGARGNVGSYGLRLAKRFAAFPAKHGMFLGIHNHDNLSDPDAFNNEESFVKGLAYGPQVKATLDVRHFTAGDGDCLGFMQRHHARMSSVHLGDRRRNNGRSTPFGEGDAPIVQILRMIRDNQWPMPVILEFEHGTLRPQVEEVQLMFDYCKRALAT
jgi:sugar phosphate isomerase/epimerase